jgi:hypothetical protein
MQTSKMLMMLGSALVSSKLGQSVGAFELDDVLGVMGLARRRSDLGQSLLLLGVGAAVGAGVALLWAPASGSETRKRLGQPVEKLGEQAVAALEQVQSGAPANAHRSNHRSGSIG